MNIQNKDADKQMKQDRVPELGLPSGGHYSVDHDPVGLVVLGDFRHGATEGDVFRNTNTIGFIHESGIHTDFRHDSIADIMFARAETLILLTRTFGLRRRGIVSKLPDHSQLVVLKKLQHQLTTGLHVDPLAFLEGCAQGRYHLHSTVIQLSPDMILYRCAKQETR